MKRILICTLASILAFSFLPFLATNTAAQDEGLYLFDPEDADYFVRTNGHDSNCNGEFDDDETPTGDCAFATLMRAVEQANLDGGNKDIQIETGYSFDMPAGTDTEPVLIMADDIRIQGNPEDPGRVSLKGGACVGLANNSNYTNDHGLGCQRTIIHVEQGDGFELSGLSLLGDGNTERGILIGGATFGPDGIDNDGAGDDIQVTQKDVVIKNIIVKDIVAPNVQATLASSPDSLRLFTGSGIDFFRNDLTTNPSGFENIQVINNEIERTDTAGIRIIAFDHTAGVRDLFVNEDIIIEGNVLDDTYRTAEVLVPPSVGMGNFIEELHAGAIHVTGFEDFSITNNTIEGSELGGIWINAPFEGGASAVTGNVIDDVALGAIFFYEETVFDSETGTSYTIDSSYESEDLIVPAITDNTVGQLNMISGFILGLGGIVDYELEMEYDGDPTLEQYFPYYNDNGADTLTWILLSNVGTNSQEVIVRMGGFAFDAVELNEDEIYTARYQVPEGGIGPVMIQSEKEGIIASQRTLYNGRFSEYTGIVRADFDDELYFTHYDNTNSYGAFSTLFVANPQPMGNAEIDIEINGNTYVEDYELEPGELMNWMFDVAEGGEGPVKITSTQDVIASQRSIWGNSLNEISAIGKDRINATDYN